MKNKSSLILLSIISISFFSSCARRARMSIDSSFLSSSSSSDTNEQGSVGDKGSSSLSFDSSSTNIDDGVDFIDLAKASPVKDVHDQGYYLDGCPTTGNVNVLVIPVEFSDVTASTRNCSIDVLKKAFNSKTNDDLLYPSVASYYEESSNHKLHLNFDVLDKWYKPSHPSTYYLGKGDYSNMDQDILEEILDQLDSSIDFTKYNQEKDKNGSIDAIVMINTLTIDASGKEMLRWAYRFWNQKADYNGNYIMHDNVYANDYLWASYDFLRETDYGFNSNNPNNTYTFIHEFGHVLGADDYYDYEGSDGPLNSLDVMDSTFGDHNPYSKFNYGWITSTRRVVKETQVKLKEFTSTGDTLILMNNFDNNKGAYQEYYVLMYYKHMGLNKGYNNKKYFKDEGIVMYHVNATLESKYSYRETYYDVKYTNSSDDEQELIEFVKNGSNYVFKLGDTSPKVKTDTNTSLGYQFKVESLSNNEATLTITKY